MDNKSIPAKTVCIIGGGPAGLVSLRRIIERVGLKGTIYEQKDDVGGLWNYNGSKEFSTSTANLSNDSDLTDPEKVTTMYDGLSSNLPYVLMELRDFKHKNPQQTYLTQPMMHQYLKDYATHFNLWPHIQVNTTVVGVRQEDPTTPDGEVGKWIVEIHQHQNDVYKTEVFDAVIVCVGKNAHPYYPNPPIPGLESFTGKILHCKYFKSSEEFKGKNVVCIGLGPSSGDLALILSKVANKVTLCHKFAYGFKFGLLPSNTREAKTVTHVTLNEVVTEDDETIPCDAIILCTGYAQKFPYLKPDSGVTVINDKYIPHLYNMTIFSKRPTLAVLNMCYRSPEYLIIEIQARYFASTLDGTLKLPSYEEMETQIAGEEAEKRKQGIPISLWFQVGDLGIGGLKYFTAITETMGIREECRNFPLFNRLYRIVISRIFGKLALYKKDKFKIINESMWEMELSSSSEFPDSKPEKITLTLNADGTLNVDSEIL